jgi:hypothetical protein
MCCAFHIADIYRRKRLNCELKCSKNIFPKLNFNKKSKNKAKKGDKNKAKNRNKKVRNQGKKNI